MNEYYHGKKLPNKKKKQAYRLGIYAEWLTIIYYRSQGYKLLRWRYLCPRGEIDLIFRKRRFIICVEVKSRRYFDQGLPKLIPINKRKRIENSLRYFISYHKQYQKCAVRFDAVFIRPWRWPIRIKNAW